MKNLVAFFIAGIMIGCSNSTEKSLKERFLETWNDDNCYINYYPFDTLVKEVYWESKPDKYKIVEIKSCPTEDTSLIMFAWNSKVNENYSLSLGVPFIVKDSANQLRYICGATNFQLRAEGEEIGWIEKQLDQALERAYYITDDGTIDKTFWRRAITDSKIWQSSREQNKKAAEQIVSVR